MTKASDPKITDFFGEDFTKVTFSPDLAKFKMTHLDKDTVELMSRRAYDVAASTRGVKVCFTFFLDLNIFNKSFTIVYF